ncbi:uncharacterized protein LOC131226058 isoform X2 [Magnolia sinica]|uniref:uncharacterized protein LOC131226058 isoform X2 n=1 Tax=Magnolia sinica TaxID=86752 RepID=UPI00265AC1F0|nr:uncharacterized protein LOC131226058 isoform X2 [Magnolia sinica]XP_058077711.1 uncharacterized protein LOC131226058 isoform X2 [Magnolia sinica]
MWADAQQNSEMTDSFNETSTPTQSPVKTPPVATRCSPRVKTMKSLAEPSSRAPKIKWTSAMDQILFDTFLEQVALGRKADNGFKREAYQIAADEVTKHTGVFVTWQNVFNRVRYYKREYTAVKDMLAASGFGWDTERMVVTAPDEVWEQYLRSHPNAARLRGKRIDRMDDLAIICGSDQATGRYVRGSRSMAALASSSRLQRDLNEAWNSVDDDMDDTIDLSEDYVTVSTGTIPLPSDSPATGHHGSRDTPTSIPDSDGTRGGIVTRKRSRPPRPCDVLGASLNTVAESMMKFGLGKQVNRTKTVLDVLEEVKGLNTKEFIDVGEILSKDKMLASFFVSL